MEFNALAVVSMHNIIIYHQVHVQSIYMLVYLKSHYQAERRFQVLLQLLVVHSKLQYQAE